MIYIIRNGSTSSRCDRHLRRAGVVAKRGLVPTAAERPPISERFPTIATPSWGRSSKRKSPRAVKLGLPSLYVCKLGKHASHCPSKTLSVPRISSKSSLAGNCRLRRIRGLSFTSARSPEANASLISEAEKVGSDWLICCMRRPLASVIALIVTAHLTLAVDLCNPELGDAL